MSIIEKQTPQKRKTFKEYKQDHGDAARQKSFRLNANGIYTDIRLAVQAKKTAEMHRSALEDADYQEMSPSQLEAAANDLLDEEPIRTQSDLMEASSEVLEIGDEAFDDLFERYRLIENQKSSLLEDIGEESEGRDTTETLELIALLDADLESIREEIIDAANERTRFPTEAEFGVKSKHEIRRKLASQATLDSGVDDDEEPDSDYQVPIRIRNRL